MSSSTEPRIPVGLVGKPHGVRGEVTVAPLTDNPERFAAGARFRTDDGRRLEVAASRSHRGALLVKFVGCDDRTAAEELRGVNLTISASERRPLDDGEFWPDQLEGMAVLGTDGTRLGTVVSVVLGDAQDRLVVELTGGGTVEVPFVDGIVGEVHPSGGFVVVDPPEGLL